MLKRRFALSLLLVLLFIGLFSAQAALARQSSIRILYLNDFHGFAEPYRPFGSFQLQGGIAYLAFKANQLRREKPSLLLAAGDMIHGDNWANLFQGASVIELMNAMQFDAMVLGNHEFDFGQEVLRQRIAQANFPLLGANVQGFPTLKPYVLKEVAGVKVGIIGVITPDTAVSTHPKNVVGLTFASPAETVKKYLTKLRPKADLILVLSHLGYRADRALAGQVPGIDLIVGGHTHTKLARPVKVNGAIIVQAYEHGKVLGVLDLALEDSKIIAFNGRLEEIKPTGPADPENLKIFKNYEKPVDTELNVPVGRTEVDLDGVHVRSQETNLGNFVADVIREKANAQAALINGGSIRASIPRGIITRKSIYTALPYSNYIVTFKLTGRQIKTALEHGVSSEGYHAGRFPQVSGLSFTFRRRAPVGSRVVKVFLDGQPIKDHKEYTVATNDFLAAGGDGYRVFVEALKTQDYGDSGGVFKSNRLAYSDPGTWVGEALIDYLKTQKSVAPQVEGRIRELNS